MSAAAATKVIAQKPTQKLSAKPTQLLPEVKKATADQQAARDVIAEFNRMGQARKAQQAEAARRETEKRAEMQREAGQKKQANIDKAAGRLAAKKTKDLAEKPRGSDTPISDVYNRVKGWLDDIPDPGSIMFPFLLILIFLFFLVRYGTQQLTRAEMIWGVLVGDLTVG